MSRLAKALGADFRLQDNFATASHGVRGFAVRAQRMRRRARTGAPTPPLGQLQASTSNRWRC
jgi:hypothetical protein